MAARLTRDFEARSAFEAKADALFLAHLARRGTTPEALVRAHEDHFKQATRALEQRGPSATEISDLRAMLAINGAAPISDSVATYCAEKSGRKGVGLRAFVASFRAEKKGKTKEREPKEGPSEAGDASVTRLCQSSAPSDTRGSKCSSAQDPTQPGGTGATRREDVRGDEFAAQTAQGNGLPSR